MECIVCKNKSNQIFKKKILIKYLVSYYQCPECKAVFTEKPYWLKEAYSSAIASTDVGLVDRNLLMTNVISLLCFFGGLNRKKMFLDYAGGYGLLVRLMRDRGYDYYWQDSYCDNLFAQQFDLNKIKIDKKGFELVTAFELFEHFEEPVREMEKILSYGDSIFITTVLQDFGSIRDIENWWYLATETGQHIVFYHQETLRFLARKYSLNFYSDSVSMALFTKKRFLINPLMIIKPLVSIIDLLNHRHKNIQRDYQFVKQTDSKQ